MKVSIVTFPATRVACISHTGTPSTEHDTVRKLVAWKLEQGLTDPSKHRQYGLHFLPGEGATGYRVDFCLSIEGDVAPNPHGIIETTIPSMRCALARDVGSRTDNQAARHLFDKWLPGSGERLSGHPAIFHYVNVGPHVKAEEAITDVYLPLR